MKERVEMLNVLKIFITLCFVIFGFTHQVSANELRATWHRGEFTALAVFDQQYSNKQRLRFASPAEYQMFGADVPAFYNKIEIAFDQKDRRKVYLHASGVRNPDNFTLVFLEVMQGQKSPIIFNVSVSDFGVTVQSDFPDASESGNIFGSAKAGSATGFTQRKADRQKSSSVRSLLEELDARTFNGSHPASVVSDEVAVRKTPHDWGWQPVGENVTPWRQVSPDWENQSPAKINSANKETEIPSDKGTEDVLEGTLPTNKTQFGYTPMTPDFILSSATMASDLGHYKTVFTMASFFVFFLALSILFLMVVRFVKDDKSSSSLLPAQGPVSATSKDDSFSNKAFEIQAAQLDRVIALLAQGHPQPMAPTTHQSPVSADATNGQPLVNHYPASNLASRDLDNSSSTHAVQSSGSSATEVAPSPSQPKLSSQSRAPMPPEAQKTSSESSVKKADESLQPLQPARPKVEQSPATVAQVRRASELNSVSNQKTVDTVRSGAILKPDQKKVEDNEVFKLSEQSRIDPMANRKSEKLDLINVYRDMGDFHMARSLARGLAKNGDAFEKIAAQKILDELK